MRHSLRLFSFVLAALVTAVATSDVPAFAQPRPEGSGGGLQLLEELSWTKEHADSIANTMSIVQWEPKYCLPPDEPNKGKERQWLKARKRSLDNIRKRFNALKPQFIDLITRDGLALKAVLGKLPDGANPAADSTFWQPWMTSFKKAQEAIDAKAAELEPIPEEDCSPPPPPPRQPVDWTAGLTPPTFGPPDFPALPDFHCSWDDYWALIRAIHPYYNKSAEDAQTASRYRDKVGGRLVRAKDAGAPADAVAKLQKIFEEASAVAAAQQNLSAKAKAHYEKAKRIPVVDCATKPEPADTGGTFAQPNYEAVQPTKLPARFCSEAEKQKFLDEVKKNHEAARRNYEKANALAGDLRKRLDAGDRTAGLPTAQRQASEAATRYYNLWIELDRAYYKAQAMPIENCGGTTTGDKGVIRGAELGAEVGAEGPPPPPPALPATGSGAKEFGVRYEGGYIETDTPQQFIGRVVIGGDDAPMIYTSPSLAGFYAQVEADPWDTNLRYVGDFGGFRLSAIYSDAEGDEYRRIEADPAITTGFVWIDPLDPGTPFAVGLGSTNLTWDARTSTNQIDVAAMAIYMEYRSLSPDLTGGVGVGVMADYRNTEHRTRIENLDFAGFAVDENYDFETFGLGPRIEAMLDWDCDPEADGPFPSFGATLRAHAAGTYDWRSSEISQRATGPFFGGFDYAQRVKLDDDGFNLRYGVDATLDLKFDARTTAILKVGWQGQSDAPTIVPADGSFAPGAPIRADTDNASEWFVGAGLRIEF